MFDDPLIARIVAPDLTAAVRHYSDGEFATIVRHGLRPDGRSVLIMPSEAYAPMTDGDLVRILAFLRSLPPANGLAPAVRVGPLGRLGLVSGKFRTTAQRFEAHQAPTPARDSLGSQGRYLAQVACGHCHGRDLHGTSNPSFTSPDLRAVAAYSPDTFATLIRTGQALGGRELGTMSPWARSNLSYLTEDEVAALYAYLSAMARE
jgi:mono/diheme cytochrome c family protein